jgi:hypothetical protein
MFHANIPLTRLKQFHIEPTEHIRQNHIQLHYRQVLADATARALAERYVVGVQTFPVIRIHPPLGIEGCGLRIDGGVGMHVADRHRHYRPGWEGEGAIDYWSGRVGAGETT